MDLWIPHERIVNCGNLSGARAIRKFCKDVVRNSQNEVFVWSFKCPEQVVTVCRDHGIKLTRVEDGFLRSIDFGSRKTPPLSLCMDDLGIYFDPTQPSRLEEILSTFPFAEHPEILDEARRSRNTLLASKLSKYNTGYPIEVEEIYGPKTRKRILVVGQVEGDMSIIKGCKIGMNNNDLVRIAADENPDAEIIYRPHPEVLAGLREQESDPADVSSIARIVTDNITLSDSFQTIDHVYTITSLSGFEALLRGIKVTCLGAPFYSGWGLTDDRQKVERRTRRLTLDELFAGAYLLYPTYRNPNTGERLTFSEALEFLQAMKRAADSARLAAAMESNLPSHKDAVPACGA